MIDYFVYMIESALCMGVFYLLYRLSLRKEKCFGFNRFYLLASLLLSLAFPLINISNLHFSADLKLLTYQMSAVAMQSQLFDADKFNWMALIMVVYFSGAAFFASKLIYQLSLLYNVIKSEKSIKEQANGVIIIQSQDKLPVFSFFNYLFLNIDKTLGEQEKQQIIVHEKAHIIRKHSYDIIGLQILKIILWPNPFLLLYNKALCDTHEFEADAYVLASANKADYSRLIVKQTFKALKLSIVNPFNKSQILKRLNMINSNKNTGPLKYLLPFPLAFLLFFVFSCEDNIENPVTEIKSETKHAIPIGPDKDIFTVVEVSEMPQPKGGGGMKSLLATIGKNLQYPEEAINKKIEGRVYLEFVIDEEGDLKDVKVLKGIGAGCDEAAVEALKKSADFSPGLSEGKPVKVKIIVPILFRLD